MPRPEGFSILSRANVQWRNNSDALVAGPIPAGEYTTLPVALQPSDVALQVYLGANR